MIKCKRCSFNRSFAKTPSATKVCTSWRAIWRQFQSLVRENPFCNKPKEKKMTKVLIEFQSLVRENPFCNPTRTKRTLCYNMLFQSLVRENPFCNVQVRCAVLGEIV